LTSGSAASVDRAAIDLELEEAVTATSAVYYLFGGNGAAVQTEVPALEALGRSARVQRRRARLVEDDRCGFALRDGTANAYNQEAFHYFLGIEQRRAEAGSRPLLMLLLEFEHENGVTPLIDARTARKLFAVLCRSLRDTDFVGWYRDGYLIGGVLTQPGHPSRVDLVQIVRERLAKSIERALPQNTAKRLRLRLYSLSPSVSGSK
jgi:hypothetical protein